jgi:hypothetical protein
VSDELDLAAESADATAEPGTPSSPPPWGDEFDPARAWQTITHLRDRERELESEAKFAKAIREDPNALKEFLAEQGYELPDDEDDDDPDLYEDTEDDPIAPLRSDVQSIKEFIEAQKAERAVDGFAKHLDSLSTEAELALTDREKQIVFRDALDLGGLTKANTEKAFKAHVEWLRDRESQLRQGWQEKKKTTAPAVKSGQSATQVPDLDDDRARQAWMIEQMANREAS